MLHGPRLVNSMFGPRDRGIAESETAFTVYALCIYVNTAFVFKCTNIVNTAYFKRLLTCITWLNRLVYKPKQFRLYVNYIFSISINVVTFYLFHF